MSKFNRRQFLEDSMLAAAAAAAVGPAQFAFAAAEERSANEMLNVAVLGVHGRGNDHIGGFVGNKNTRITYICDPDEAVGQKGVANVKKKQGMEPKWERDLRKVFDDKSVDIVSIATPNHWHSLAAIWAIQAGKDVYVEKPVSHNVSEGRRVVEAARKYNKVVQTGTQCRSMGGTVQAIEYIKSGKIGEVKLARGLCYKPRGSIGKKGTYQPPESLDYDIWCGPAPMAPLTRPKLHYDWHWVWATGCGDLGNQGIHQMDIARWGLGVDDLGQSVLAYGGRYGYEDAGETANTQVSIHDYGDKTLVFEVRGLKTSGLAPVSGALAAKIGVIFYGSEGYVVLNSYNGGAAFDKEGKEVKKFSAGGDHYGNFINCVMNRKPEELHADILQGHLSSALCHLGNISYRMSQKTSPEAAAEQVKALKGSEDTVATFQRVAEHLEANKVMLANDKVGLGPHLTLDGKKEVFTGELASKANPMLTRPYRAPFVVPAQGQV